MVLSGERLSWRTSAQHSIRWGGPSEAPVQAAPISAGLPAAAGPQSSPPLTGMQTPDTRHVHFDVSFQYFEACLMLPSSS
jgi:hypothetical protein